MSEYVADTHALHWHLTGDNHLSPTARQLLAEADAGLHRIHVPSIILVEMIYLTEKGKLAANSLQKLFVLVNTTGGSYAIAALDAGTAKAMMDIPRTAVPDMPDRIIVATACQLNLPLISRDGKIQKANVVPVVW
ncbi:MAG: PIN domain-containing protein [Chloroflexota bacterium]